MERDQEDSTLLYLRCAKLRAGHQGGTPMGGGGGQRAVYQCLHCGGGHGL